MSVARGFVIVGIGAVCFGVAGGLIGLALGAGMPDYYRGVFRGGHEPGFNPVQVGLGLGSTQGLICGTLLGSIIVLAMALARRSRPESEPADLPPHLGERKHSPWSWLRRGAAIALILAAIACGGITSFVAGAIIGQSQLYRYSSDTRLARVLPVLRELPFSGVRAEPTSNGKIDLTGSVGSERDLKALKDRMRFLFGDDDARAMTSGVDIAGK
jgi:hypothetical protein